jgi:hypothetical protein
MRVRLHVTPRGVAFSYVAALSLSVMVSHAEAQPQPRPMPSPMGTSVGDEQAESARRMDERMARHERAAKRALSGICEGCGPGLPRWRGRHAEPHETVGEDGLPFDPTER